ncbi:alkaline phosphatase-like [Mya arenaria]|uniref:alkaline phosphatase-like n=1 Tax=Mya arenaria TaxID=6604 RepID=UPI0022E74F00|nr:alkaline phosphatase-like [Mya arenaria]XP_052791687.1 alkaline phosphatase-like [Mya arenaria]
MVGQKGRGLLLAACTMVILVSLAVNGQNIPKQELNPEFWRRAAQNKIEQRLKQKENHNKAKNIILFIGDGMGPTTVTAARILKGQLAGQPGEESVFNFEKFPNVALSKTYNVDRQTPDSAGTATAILTGVKTNYFLVGLDPRTTALDCESQHGRELETILDWAHDAGKKTGVVTTARITHATPAAAYAHSADRYWEGDVDTQDITGGCRDIAQQLVDDNGFIDVLFGGGRRYFLPNTTLDPEYSNIDKNHRLDGRNLIEDWKKGRLADGKRAEFVWNKKQFENLDASKLDSIMGLFEPNHMQYELERNKNDTGEPSLAEMTRKALQVLQKGSDGYFLLVEGARIDHGHHDNLAKKALYETVEMEKAVQVALELTNQKDTMIVVTADHSHPFDITGYQYRGTDIFGLVSPVDPTEDTTDGKPYSVLYYANGPSYKEPRVNLSKEDMHDNNFAFPSGVPMPWESHGGEDVAIYAQGPMSHLFHGVQEQNYIAHVMAYSACIGPYKQPCKRMTPHPSTASADGISGRAQILKIMHVK